MNKWLLMVGLVLALVTAFLLNQYIASFEASQSSAQFLRLPADTGLPKGSALDSSMLATVSLPETFADLGSFAIPDTLDNRSWISGRAVTRDVPPGSLLQFDFFADEPSTRFAATIEDGKRAMSIPVGPATSVAYFIEPGSFVDLVGTFEIMQEIGLDLPEAARRQLPAEGFPALPRLTTKTILQNVRVLAVGDVTTRAGYLRRANPSYATITIEVTPEQAEVLVFAMNELADQLTVLLRNPNNDDIIDIPEVDWSALQNGPSG